MAAAACLALGFAGTTAADNGDDQPKVTPPPPPDELKQGEAIGEPEVTIVDRDWAEIREYSVNGTVYAVRIQPKVGFPYWLYDSNGDGRLETRFETGSDVPDTHQWKLLEW